VTMEMDPELFKKLLATFTEELNEQCQSMTTDLLKLEKNKEVPNTIVSIFRSAHNIKGAARSIGVTDVGEIAHHIESLFTNIQNKSIQITPHLIDLCLQAVDTMRMSLQAFIDKKPLSFDLNQFLSRLTSDEILAPSQDQSMKTTSNADETQTTIPQDETQTTIPHMESSPKEQESIRVSVKKLDRVSSLTEEVQVTKIALDDHDEELNKLMIKAKQFDLSWKESGPIVQRLSDIESAHHLQHIQHVQQLYHDHSDRFMEMRNMIQHLNNTMRRYLNELNMLSNSLLEEVRLLRLIPVSTLFNMFPRTVRDMAHELNKHVELEITGDSVKMDKMVLEQLKDPITHLLRNAIDHGIEDAKTRQAKGKSTLGHIHIDVHEQGDNILISISDDGAGIDIKHLAKKAVAKQMMTHAECSQASDDVLLELIFRPGFTTKEIITDVSGRGIGLDVVKSNIDNLKGHIHIKTNVDQGTTFYLRVPLTLASERGLLIQSAGQPFVVLTDLIERVLNVSVDDIINVEMTQAILINKHPVPLYTLSDILDLPRKTTANSDTLGLPDKTIANSDTIDFPRKTIANSDTIGFPQKTIANLDTIGFPQKTIANLDTIGFPRNSFSKQNNLPIIVLKKGWRTIALLVEEIINEREIVIKRLQAPLNNIPCIAGGTIAYNGQVIVVLNSHDLIARAFQMRKSSPITLSDQAEIATPTRPRILVVDDSITTRTLEKNILENKNYHVTVAVNGKEAWELLQNQSFDLLITDIMMPIMDGFTLTQRVKQSDALCAMPVIIVTSLGSEIEKKRGIDVGADAYIVKNEFESDKLLQVVEQLV
jgi:two-component system, chemotaxis family, sensor kinase CheA